MARRQRKPDVSHIARELQGLAVPIDSLHADPTNLKSHDKRSIDEIASSLNLFGQRKPVVVQRKGMVVRAGNGLLEAARLLGWTMIAAVMIDDTNVDAVAFAIADNRSAEFSTWRNDDLASVLKALDDDTRRAVGFADDEFDKLLAELSTIDQAEVEADPDEIPAPPDKATTQPGDLWVLGQHRLLCGDSSKREDLDRLVAGQPIHLLNTDPPYNVNVEPRSNNARLAGSGALPSLVKAKAHLQSFDDARQGKPKATTKKMRAKDRPLANDFISELAFDRMLRAWFGNAARVMLPGSCFYVWGGYANWANYCAALRSVGLYFSQGITWVKGHPVLGRKDFMNDCEHAWYGWKEGAGHDFLGPNNVSNVWEVKKVTPQAMVHLTEKPAELAGRALEYSSKPGENVLDLFGGSGSTLIACEQHGRRAHLMEIDPLYCDVIVQRWEAFAGGKAKRVKASGTAARPEKTPAKAGVKRRARR